MLTFLTVARVARIIVNAYCLAVVKMPPSTFRAAITTTLALYAFSAPSLGASVAAEAADAAFRRDDYAVAFALARPVAETGDAAAQYRLGVLLRNGLGTEKNAAAAAQWFLRAAEQKHSNAMTDLAALLQDGDGIEKDTRRAAALLTDAAEQGNAVAQFKLGEAYQHGKGVTKSVIHARYWYERADAQQVAAELKANPPKGGRVGFKSLPDACKPKRPPVYEMNRARVKEFSGVVTAVLDHEGRVRGVTDQTISHPDLKYVAVAWFSETLRDPECQIPSERRGYSFGIPFKFVLH